MARHDNGIRMNKFLYHLKEECNKDIGCQFEPCLSAMRALSTPSEFFLSEQILETLK